MYLKSALLAVCLAAVACSSQKPNVVLVGNPTAAIPVSKVKVVTSVASSAEMVACMQIEVANNDEGLLEGLNALKQRAADLGANYVLLAAPPYPPHPGTAQRAYLTKIDEDTQKMEVMAVRQRFSSGSSNIDKLDNSNPSGTNPAASTPGNNNLPDLPPPVSIPNPSPALPNSSSATPVLPPLASDTAGNAASPDPSKAIPVPPSARIPEPDDFTGSQSL